MQFRQPIVAILGHVDHGKTTLLDYIRKSRVASGEAGGITQSIGAYQAEFKNKKLTFIDTPGHAAFSQMRSRGATVADVVVLVVAADDSVKPQTIESIKHIKEAGTPFVVAINKIDKPEANVEVVKAELTQHQVFVEGYGGNTPFVLISGKSGTGVDSLLETILLLAELEELPYTPEGELQAPVIEAKLDQKRGILVSLIIKSGTLKVGETVSGGLATGKVRAILSETGENLKTATPGMPVQVLGFTQLPTVGDTVKSGDPVLGSELRAVRSEAKDSLESSVLSAELLVKPNPRELKVILKADTSGSLEAIKNSFAAEVRCITCETGEISERDILHAAATGSTVLGFNLKISASVLKLAETEGVVVKSYKIIYELLEYIEKKVLKLMEPTIDEQELGRAKVIKIFEMNGAKIAGCRVESGRFETGDTVHLNRADGTVKDARIKSMRIGKDEMKKVESVIECGILLFPNLDIIEKDDIISYKKIVEDL